MTVSVRRIIAAQTSAGSRIVADLPAKPVAIRPESGMGGAILWSTGAAPTIEVDADDPLHLATDFFPPPGETRFILVVFAPGARSHMHASDTIDMTVVHEGEIELEVDQGEPTVARAGDVLVFVGANHKWVNRTDKTTRIFTTLVGATPAAEGRP